MSLRSSRVIGPAFPHLASPFAATGGGGSPTPGVEAAAFLTRAAAAGGAPDTTHTDAYVNLINNLVTDGVWALLDVLQVYAADTSAHAVLNLKSSSYTATLVGSPTFTADRGFSFPGGSEVVYINFNPSTGTNYLQDAASIGVWCVTFLGGLADLISNDVSSGTSDINPWYNAGNYLISRINDGAFVGASGAVTNGLGFTLGNRASGGAVTSYRNGTLIDSGSVSSGTPPNGLLFISNNAGAQVSAACAGGNLAAVQSVFYTRLRTYMTALGVP